MVSEGVDIPRLRVGVFATTTTTELFFRQAVGRLVRWTPGVRTRRRTCSSPTTRGCGPGRSRSPTSAGTRLRKRAETRPERDPAALDDRLEEQLSLFAALSAVATDHEGHDELDRDDVDDDLLEDDDPALLLALAPPPPLADGRMPADLGIEVGGAAGRTRREEKRQLRDQNADLVAALVRRTGRTHAEVNRELNRLAGIVRVTEATVTQLRSRLDAGERWLRSA